jgi:hypothetical protein
VPSRNRYNQNIKITHLQDKWIKNTKENQRRKNSQPGGKAKRQADRRGDQLLGIAGWNRFALDPKI